MKTIQKLLLYSLPLLFLLFIQPVLLSPSHPENIGIDDPQEKARQYGITFPISELGNCASYSDCRNYCEDPVNSSSCIAFAKKKGFYKDEGEQKIKSVLNRAKRELGCSLESSCREFCEQPENYDKCASFARKTGVEGGYVESPDKKAIVERAKQSLGCDSPQSCQTFCEQESNREKCSNFAKEVGLRGGEQHVGPGGCTSEQTCQTFCSDPNNYQICAKYGSSSGGRFTGPGGCNSEESCRAYCKDHPQECGYGGDGGTGGGGTTGGTGDKKQRAEEYAKFCQENPDKCRPGESGGFDSSQQRQNFEKYCRENPDKCGAPPQPTGRSGPYQPPNSDYNPQEMCNKTPNCSWVNNSCQCTSSGGTSGGTGGQQYNPPPAGGYSTNPATGCAQAGCSWTGTNCQCQQQQQQQTTQQQPPPQAPQPQTSSGGAPPPSTSTESPPPSTGTYSPPPGTVYGARTSPSLIRSILQLFLNL